MGEHSPYMDPGMKRTEKDGQKRLWLSAPLEISAYITVTSRMTFVRRQYGFRVQVSHIQMLTDPKICSTPNRVLNPIAALPAYFHILNWTRTHIRVFWFKEKDFPQNTILLASTGPFPRPLLRPLQTHAPRSG